MNVIGIALIIILALTGFGSYLIRQDTRLTNVYLARIERQLEEILKHAQQK